MSSTSSVRVFVIISSLYIRRERKRQSRDAHWNTRLLARSASILACCAFLHGTRFFRNWLRINEGAVFLSSKWYYRSIAFFLPFGAISGASFSFCLYLSRNSREPPGTRRKVGGTNERKSAQENFQKKENTFNNSSTMCQRMLRGG